MNDNQKGILVALVGVGVLALAYLIKRPVTGISVHPHGSHECYCPTCRYAMTVTTGIKCNTLSCPQCATMMRAVEPGEFRTAYRNPMARVR